MSTVGHCSVLQAEHNASCPQQEYSRWRSGIEAPLHVIAYEQDEAVTFAGVDGHGGVGVADERIDHRPHFDGGHERVPDGESVPGRLRFRPAPKPAPG
jgi:hypothetical protein